MTLQFSDWSTHLMQAEIQIKAAEHCLLHKDYDSAPHHARAAIKALEKTIAWVAKQGSSKGVDVVQILEDNLPALNEPMKSLMISAINEIGQLRSERQFWLKAGFDIGKADAVKK